MLIKLRALIFAIYVYLTITPSRAKLSNSPSLSENLYLLSL